MASIVFFGTPDFAAHSLKQLALFCQNHGHKLVAVVTQPDKKQGRKQLLLPSAVKRLALDLGLNILQPETLKKDSIEGDRFFNEFQSLKPDIAIVVAYGKIITKRLLAIPHLGFINIHASLLPKLRGAAPIQRAILEGFNETGVCLMQMDSKLDEGDVFVCQKTPILPTDTFQSLSCRLSIIGARLLLKNLPKLLLQKLQSYPQDHKNSSYAHMLEKSEGFINFTEPGRLIYNKTKAFDPWPGTYGFLDQRRIKFFDSFFLTSSQLKKDYKPGQILSTKPYLAIKTVDGIIFFNTLQLEGKKPLPAKNVCRGSNIKPGMIFLKQPLIN